MRPKSPWPKPWTSKDLKEFVRLYPDTTTAELAVRFKRSESAIRNKAVALKVHKTSSHLSRIGHNNLNNLRWYQEKVRESHYIRCHRCLKALPPEDSAHTCMATQYVAKLEARIAELEQILFNNSDDLFAKPFFGEK